jgi:two-component system KDP operon response regulator KdpE
MTSAPERSGARILLIEDDMLNRSLVRAVLARSARPELRDLLLIEAGDLAQARAALADAPVDAVLLDMGLPDGSGLELATELRDAHAGTPPAVVAVTGDSGPSQASDAMAAGCHAVLTKPYSPADLCDLLVSLLHGDPGHLMGSESARPQPAS